MQPEEILSKQPTFSLFFCGLEVTDGHRTMVFPSKYLFYHVCKFQVFDCVCLLSLVRKCENYVSYIGSRISRMEENFTYVFHVTLELNSI